MNQFHPFHLVTKSPWPFVISLAISSVTLSSITVFMNYEHAWFLLFTSCLSVLSVLLVWWRDVVRESTFQGHHTYQVMVGIRLGMVLFILSEAMFFFSFFFGWFSISLNPDPSLGGVIPPVGVTTLSYLEVPLLNTVILLSSGVSVTWAHHALLIGKSMSVPLFITCLLGIVFMGFQIMEYYEIPYCISDSVYGSIFFLTTGFHGLHVLIGTSFLIINLLRSMSWHMSATHHLGFEAGAWYWHFVDVVWLFLFVSIYWWGS